MRLYRNKDNGELYEMVDLPVDHERFEVIEVPNTLQLTPQQCCGHDNDIVEILLAAGQAKIVKVP